MRTILHKPLCIAILLLFVFSAGVSGQHILDFRIDSLQKLIAKAPPDTHKVQSYLHLISNYHYRYLYHGSQPADSVAILKNLEACQFLSKQLKFAYGLGACLLWESHFYYYLKNDALSNKRLEEAFSILRSIDNKKGLARAYHLKAEMRPTSDTSINRFNLYDTAAKFAREAGDTYREVSCLKAIANLHVRQGKYSLAITELLNLLEQQKKRGDNNIHYTTDLLSNAFNEVANFKESLRYAITTLDYSRKSGDTITIVTFYQRLGFIYEDMHNYDKAFYYFDRALSALPPGKPAITNNVVLNILDHMSYCLISQHKFQQAFDFLTSSLKRFSDTDIASQAEINGVFLDIYYFLGRYKEAEQCLLKKMKIPIEQEIIENSQLDLFTRAGQLYFQLKQFDKASRFSVSAFAIAAQLNSRENLMENSLTLYKLDSLRGDYISAIKHYQQYKAYSDSIHEIVSNRQAAELAVQYETDQTNNQLQLLTDKAQLQQQTIKQGILVRNSMIAGSGLLLLLLFVTFNRYRIKQKITAEKDKLLTEKEWLMKEINHRVKNNLQVVMSLLNSQSAYLKDEAALNAIQESRHRVHAISLIHQKLYQTELQLTVIDMGPYIKEVTEYLAESMNTGPYITFNLHIDPVELDVTQAVPTGLIINEAITNSVKYAFPNGRKGQIRISLHEITPGSIDLIISDDGIGLPPHFDWQHTESLGMSLMRGLSKQLDGKFEVEPGNGLTIKLHFEPVKIGNA